MKIEAERKVSNAQKEKEGAVAGLRRELGLVISMKDDEEEMLRGLVERLRMEKQASSCPTLRCATSALSTCLP